MEKKNCYLKIERKEDEGVYFDCEGDTAELLALFMCMILGLLKETNLTVPMIMKGCIDAVNVSEDDVIEKEVQA